MTEKKEMQVFNIHNLPARTNIKQVHKSIILTANLRQTMGYFFFPFMIIWTIQVIYGFINGNEPFNEGIGFNLIFVTLVLLIVSLAFWSVTLMMLWGKVEITIDEEYIRIFRGVGKIGDNRIFKLEGVYVDKKNPMKINGKNRYVLMKNKANLLSSRDLTMEQYDYLMMAIDKILEDKNQGKKFWMQGAESEDISEHLLES